MFEGKRLDRMRFPSQVAVDPELGSEIRRRAAKNMRTLGAEIVRLLTLGILNDTEEVRKEINAPVTHSFSRRITDRELGQKVDGHFQAQPRTAGHGNSQRRRSA